MEGAKEVITPEIDEAAAKKAADNTSGSTSGSTKENSGPSTSTSGNGANNSMVVVDDSVVVVDDSAVDGANDANDDSEVDSRVVNDDSVVVVVDDANDDSVQTIPAENGTSVSSGTSQSGQLTQQQRELQETSDKSWEDRSRRLATEAVEESIPENDISDYSGEDEYEYDEKPDDGDGRPSAWKHHG